VDHAGIIATSICLAIQRGGSVAYKIVISRRGYCILVESGTWFYSFGRLRVLLVGYERPASFSRNMLIGRKYKARACFWFFRLLKIVFDWLNSLSLLQLLTPPHSDAVSWWKEELKRWLRTK
jgi:hypothetical protein